MTQALIVFADKIPSQSGGKLPETFKIRFYLNEPALVSIVVRELRKNTYYLLDSVTGTWKAGNINGFEWSTRRVIQPLGLSMDKLGVVVRTGNGKEYDAVVHVAPAIFHNNLSMPPSRVNRYEFTFRSRVPGTFYYEVFPKGHRSSILETNMIGESVNADSPIPAEWDASKASDGEYVVLVSLKPNDSNTKIHQSVEFYHRSMIQ